MSKFCTTCGHRITNGGSYEREVYDEVTSNNSKNKDSTTTNNKNNTKDLLNKASSSSNDNPFLTSMSSATTVAGVSSTGNDKTIASIEASPMRSLKTGINMATFCGKCDAMIEDIPPSNPPLFGIIKLPGPQPGVDGVIDVPLSSEEENESKMISSLNKKGSSSSSGNNSNGGEDEDDEDNDEDRDQPLKSSEMSNDALESHRRKIKYYAPPEHMDMVYGYVERHRGQYITSFHFRREADDKFIMAATMEADLTGKIYIHTKQEIKGEGRISQVPSNDKDPNYIGILIPNFLGTEFVLHDYRVKYQENKLTPSVNRAQRPFVMELAYLKFDVNILGRVPNSLKATFPRWEENFSDYPQNKTIKDRYAEKTVKRELDETKTLGEKIKALQNKELRKEYTMIDSEEKEELLLFGLLIFLYAICLLNCKRVLLTMSINYNIDTAKPQWSEEMQAWTLNFNGRVNIASKKNIILTPSKENESMDEEFGSETTCVRFGKFTKHRFSLDHRYPVSPIQAFSVALSTFAKKKVVT